METGGGGGPGGDTADCDGDNTIIHQLIQGIKCRDKYSAYLVKFVLIEKLQKMQMSVENYCIKHFHINDLRRRGVIVKKEGKPFAWRVESGEWRVETTPGAPHQPQENCPDCSLVTPLRPTPSARVAERAERAEGAD